MADTVIPYRFLVRGGTAADLAAVNEIPLARELVVETDTRKMKMGNGVQRYNALPYIGGSGGSSDDITEGVVNLFFTAARATAAVGAAIYAGEHGIAGDLDWPSVLTLFHFDGVDGSSVFTDSKGRTWTNTGSPVLTTANKKFGTASLRLPGSSYLSTAVGTDFTFGTGDFTVEGWVYATSKDRVLLETRPPSSTGLVFYQQADGYLGAYCNMGTTTTVLGTTDIVDGNWHHVAFVRQAGVLRIYLDGVLNGSGPMANNLIGNTRAFLGASNNGGQTWVGGIDEFRVTKGVARYTANFTPTGPFLEGGFPANDGISLIYDADNNMVKATNTDKGSTSVANYHARVSTVNVATLASGAVSLNLDSGLNQNFSLALTANATLSVANPQAAGKVTEFELQITQDTTGGRTLTLPASFRPLGGSDTLVSPAGGSVTVLSAKTFDGGTTWRYAMQESA